MVWTLDGSEALAKILGVERLTPEIVAILEIFGEVIITVECSSSNGGRVSLIYLYEKQSNWEP